MRSGRVVIWSIGLFLAIAGLLSLSLSYSIFSGWWQGTTQAIGVGLLVGGLVDVIVISSLESIIRNAEERRKKADAAKDAARERFAQTQRTRDDEWLATLILHNLRSDSSFESKAKELAYYIEVHLDNPGVRDALLSKMDRDLRRAALRIVADKLGQQALQQLDKRYLVV